MATKKQPVKGKGEGSKSDLVQDRAGAKVKGMSMKAYEGTADDRKKDAARQSKCPKCGKSPCVCKK